MRAAHRRDGSRPAAAQLLWEFTSLPASKTTAGWSAAVFSAPSPCSSDGLPGTSASPPASPRSSPRKTSAMLTKEYFDSVSERVSRDYRETIAGSVEATGRGQ